MTDRTKEKIKRDIIEWARQHDFFIHADVVRNWDAFLRKVRATKGGCPCSPRRLHCPCPESENDILRDRGACVCTLFCNEAYIEKYASRLKLAKKDFFKPDRVKN